MTDQPEPRWELLPHEPRLFFALADDFELRDLKRSYNQLVKRFKPEKFPVEFQRIRAAYEELNDERRYSVDGGLRRSGRQIRDPQPDRPPPPPGPEPTAMKEQQLATPADRPEIAHSESLPEGVADVQPSALYEELKHISLKTAGNYVSLALLSDVVAPDVPGESFHDWLLAGLATEPRDLALTRLLRASLTTTTLSLETLSALLLRAVHVLPADRFQYATERAWDRLLREGTFDQFRDCLEQCGARLGREVDHSQLVFYIHVLKLALWDADDAFIEELRTSIEDHFHALDDSSQREYELVSQLLDYRAQRAAFVARGECCARIDAALRDWCRLPEPQGDASVLDCQYFLSSRGQKLLDEFPDHRADLSFVILPWEYAVSDVLERLSDLPEHEEGAVAHHTRAFMIRAMRRRTRSLTYYFDLFLIVLAIELFVFAAVGVIAFAIHALVALGRQHWLRLLADAMLLVLSAVIGVVGPVVLFVYCRRLTRQDYRPARRALIGLLRVAPLRAGDLADALAARDGEKFEDDSLIVDTDLVAEPLRNDAALEIFSLAQVCLSAAAPEEIVAATLS